MESCAPNSGKYSVYSGICGETSEISEASNEAEMTLASNLDLASKPKLGVNTNPDPNPDLTSTEITSQTQPKH